MDTNEMKRVLCSRSLCLLSPNPSSAPEPSQETSAQLQQVETNKKGATFRTGASPGDNESRTSGLFLSESPHQSNSGVSSFGSTLNRRRQTSIEDERAVGRTGAQSLGPRTSIKVCRGARLRTMATHHPGKTWMATAVHLH